MKKKNLLYSRVVALCHAHGTLRRSYSRLCMAYWTKFNAASIRDGNWDLMNSPESICRAFRIAVRCGDINLSEKDIAQRKALRTAMRQMVGKNHQ